MPDLKPMPYKEAVDFFKKRIVMSPSAFEKMAEGANNAAKARAFTVAGVARMDVLSDIHGAMEKAIADGETFGDFRNRIDEIMENRGWKGLAPHRLENIFRTNIQTSYMAGRHAQMKQVAKRRLYWQYNAVNDGRTRPTHAAMNGKVYPHDHPFWNTWYPPNGYRCRCSVTSISKAELEEEGLTVEKEIPKDPVTGEAYRPDKGWNFNPAEDVWKGMAEQVAKDIPKAATPLIPFSGERLKKYGLQSIKEMDASRFPKAKELPGYEDLLRQKIDPIPFYKKELKKSLGMEGESAVLPAADGSYSVFNGLLFGHLDWKNRGRYVPMIRETYETPDEIWLNVMKVEGKSNLRKNHIKFYRSDENPFGMVVILDFEKGIWRTLTVIPRERIKRIDSIRAGECIYSKNK